MASIWLVSHDQLDFNTFVFKFVGLLKLVPYIHCHCLLNSVMEFSSIDFESPNQQWN